MTKSIGIPSEEEQVISFNTADSVEVIRLEPKKAYLYGKEVSDTGLLYLAMKSFLIKQFSSSSCQVDVSNLTEANVERVLTFIGTLGVQESRSEFIKRYLSRTKVSYTTLTSMGSYAYPCRCGDPSCTGWQMIDSKSAKTQITLGFLTPEEVLESESFIYEE